MKLLSREYDRPFITLFVVCGILAIVCGAVVSAFSAKAPIEFTAWASAYLVLVVGLAQVGFGLIGERLATTHKKLVAWLSFTLYNLGNIGVIYGVAAKDTAHSSEIFIDGGGILIVCAVLLLCYGVHRAKRSLLLVGFYIIAAIIVVSAPIGLTIATIS